jgi:hypothetical protein
MTASDQPPTLAPDVQIQLTTSGESLRRWCRLRRLSKALRDQHSTEHLGDLRVALERCFDAAAEEAETVAVFLEENADQLDAMSYAGITPEIPDWAKAEAMRHLSEYPNWGGARNLAESLRGLPAQRSLELEALLGESEDANPEPAMRASSGFCAVAGYMYTQAQAEALAGVPDAWLDELIYSLDMQAAGC